MSQESRPRAGDWICASCGTVHESNDQPCRECAGERFARLEDTPTSRIDSAASVEYECQECGRRQPRNSTPCKHCGSLSFEPVEIDTREVDVDANEGDGRKVTGRAIVAWLYGGLTLVNGIAWFLVSVLTGLSWIGGAVIVFPPTRRRLESWTGITFSLGATIVLVGLLHALGALFALTYVAVV